MKRKDRRELLLLVGIPAVLLLVWIFWPFGQYKDSEKQTDSTKMLEKEKQDKASISGGQGTNSFTKERPANETSVLTNEKADNTDSSKTDSAPAPEQDEENTGISNATELYKAGINVFETNPLKSRMLLSKALFSQTLSSDRMVDARNRLEWLAENTLLSSSAIYRPKDDPYTILYTFKSGEVIERIERKLRLHVPTQLILKINGLTRSTQFQAGRAYKLIRGPFHAVVSKSRFTMDVYLHRTEDNLPKVFIKRYIVGLGKEGSTPLGKWRLGCGAKRDENGKAEKGKLYHAVWNPPPSSGLTQPIEYGQPGYPFGRKGLWIGLVGTDENTKPLIDYGIHSTDDPTSIGKNASLGCIRMSDKDIEEVYSMLYEYWSTVEIVE